MAAKEVLNSPNGIPVACGLDGLRGGRLEECIELRDSTLGHKNLTNAGLDELAWLTRPCFLSILIDNYENINLTFMIDQTKVVFIQKFEFRAFTVSHTLFSLSSDLSTNSKKKASW